MSSASRLLAADPDGQSATMDDTDIARTDSRTQNLIPGFESKPQNLSSTTASPPIEDFSPQASFMGIPPELRFFIYGALWAPTKRKYTIHTNHTFSGNDGDEGDFIGHAFSRRESERLEEDKKSAALLLVNRQVSREATHMMHSNSTLTLLAAKKSMWPLLHAHPTPSARAHITSINIHALASQHSFIPFLRRDYPSLETLQVFAAPIWDSLVQLFHKLISKTSHNLMLKSIAVELSFTPSFNTVSHYDYHIFRRLCHKIRSWSENILRRMGKSTTVDVLWRDCKGISESWSKED